MRTFEVSTLIIFLLFYLIVSVSGFFSLRKIFQKSKKRIDMLTLIFEIFFIGGFVIFYLYPFSPEKSFNYHIYSIVNAVVFIQIICKLPLSFSFFLHLLFRNKGAGKIINMAGVVVSISVFAVLLFGTFFGARQIKTNRIELVFKDLPSQFEGYRLMHISDSHLGSFSKKSYLLENSMERIIDLSPDVIFFTGDLVNNFGYEIREKNISVVLNYLKDIPRYSILGNHDYGNYSDWKTSRAKKENFKEIIEAHELMGFQLLRNENTVINKGKDSIYILGVENWGHPPFPQYANLNQALEGIPKNAFKILLTHDPAHWESKVKGRGNIQLSLSGHTHGLQWGIKIAGIPFSLSYLIRKKWGGLYQSENMFLYVNTGLGVIGIPWRIDMPAEITVLELKRRKIN